MAISASRRISSALIRLVKESWGDPHRNRYSETSVPIFLPENGIANIGRLVHVENDDRNLVVHAKTEGGRVHHLQPLRQGFGVGDLFVALRIGIEIRVAVVDAVDLGRFQNDVAPISLARSAAVVSVEK